MSVLVSKDVGALIASTNGGFDGQWNNRLGDVVDAVFTMAADLLRQNLYQNCFAVAFQNTARRGFAISF